MLMTQKDYADRRGVSKQYIHQLIKKGTLELVDGRIDTEAADRILDDGENIARVRRNDAGRGANASGAYDRLPTPEHGRSNEGQSKFNQARTVRESYRAQRERLDYEREVGRLVPADDVRESVGEVAALLQERLAARARTLAERCMSLNDPREIEHAVRTADREVMQWLSAELARRAGSAAGIDDVAA